MSAPQVQQPAFGGAQASLHEVGGLVSGGHVVDAIQHGAGTGKRRDHQAVPTGEDLFVPARGTRLERAASSLRRAASRFARKVSMGRWSRSASCSSERAGKDDLAFEVALVGDAPDGAGEVGEVGAERGGDFGFRPDEVLAFLAFAVGVLSRVEAAAGAGHLAQHIVEGFFADLSVERVAGRLERFEIRNT